MMLRLLPILLIAACARVPELGAVVPPDLRNAPYPQLIPLGPELTTPQDPTAEAEALSDALNGRAERLKRRARALSQAEVVDDAAKARMQAGTGG